MRRKIQTEHWLFKKKPFGVEEGRPSSDRQFLDHEKSRKWIWSQRPYCLDHAGLCTREMTLIARANGENLGQSAHSIHPSLHNFLWSILFTCNVNLWKVWPNKILVSLRIFAISMVHLYSKFLASPEKCICEKEVIRTACASLIDRCGGASRAQ